MDQIRRMVAKVPGSRTRKWLNIELSAYVLLGLFLVTTAWANHFLSAPVMVGAWVVALGFLTLALRSIYRRRHQ